jgi:hypothetical protein
MSMCATKLQAPQILFHYGKTQLYGELIAPGCVGTKWIKQGSLGRDSEDP